MKRFQTIQLIYETFNTFFDLQHYYDSKICKTVVPGYVVRHMSG